MRASETVLAVEITSDGTRRTDRSIKHGEYADAGIPHYWIVDIDDRPSLTTCHHAGEFGYADAPPATGTFTADEHRRRALPRPARPRPPRVARITSAPRPPGARTPSPRVTFGNAHPRS